MESILELGLTWRCASIRSIGVEPSNQSLLQGKEDEVFPLLLQAAQRCIDEDGADVILLGSTTMHQAHAYLRDDREFMFVAARATGGVYVIKTAQLTSVHPKLASNCK